jgi:hypothetical protein
MGFNEVYERIDLVTDDVAEMLEDLAKLTLALGMRIGSRKNDTDDLAIFSAALSSVNDTLDVIRNLMIVQEDINIDE